MNDAIMLTADISPATVSCSPDPYTLTESMPIPKAMIDEICTPSDRHQIIALAAYYRAQRRGFEPGYELDDWLGAEREINAVCGLIEPHPSWDSQNRV